MKKQNNIMKKKINKVSERTARNDLIDLCKRNVAGRIGATTSLMYVLSSAIFSNLRQKKFQIDCKNIKTLKITK